MNNLLNNTTAAHGGFRSFKDIEIPEIMFNTIKTGIRCFDRKLSAMGGFVPSQVAILTGPSGSGKTSIAIRALAELTQNPAFQEPVKNEEGEIVYVCTKKPVFISLEMSDWQLKYQMRNVPNIDEIVIVQGVKDLDITLEDIEAQNPSVVLLDSMQQLCMDLTGKADNKKAQDAFMDVIIKWAKRTFIPVIVIGHCTKAGEYKGSTTTMHMADTHLEAIYKKKEGIRFVRGGVKSRMGGTTEEDTYHFGAKGIEFDAEYENFDDDDDSASILAEMARFKTTKELPNQVSLKSERVEEETVLGLTDRFLSLREALYENVNKETYRPLLKEMLNILSRKYRNQVEGQINFTGFSLTFSDNQYSYVQKGTSQIRIGDAFIKKLKDGKPQFEKEMYVFTKYVFSHADAVAYQMLHEFCHVLTGIEHHTKEFMNELDKLAYENRDMFKH